MKIHNLPRPLGKQREVLYLPVTGHAAILGTAGSGFDSQRRYAEKTSVLQK
ncbi:MAG: hypothetical protein GX117_13350 [Candidatus Hydrogenedentes bacterium]|jgi:hypothetical protein|nr:hypothetical protein [Candidatus Hydrogenedentota bacterium]